MKRKWIITLSVLFSVFMVYQIVLNVFTQFYNDDAPTAARGVIDLSTWDLAVKGVVKLGGEWEFYPGEIIYPEEFAALKPLINPPYYGQVPANWNDYNLQGHTFKDIRSATYRLHIVNKESLREEIFGIKTVSIRMSSRIYINGQLIGGSGNPKEDATYIPQNKPYSRYFSLSGGETEIIVQIANFDSAIGSGISGPIYFGYQKDISNLGLKLIRYDNMVIFPLIMLSVLFIGLYFQRKKEFFLLYIGLFAISIVFYYLTHGEKALLLIFPSIPFSLFIKLQFISPLTFALFLILFITQIYRERVQIRIVQGFIAILILIIIIICCSPIALYSQFDIMIMVLVVLAILYTVVILILGASQIIQRSFYLLIGSLALLMFITQTIIKLLYPEIGYHFMPFQPFIFTIMIFFHLSSVGIKEFRRNEELSKRLLAMDKLKDEFLAKTSHEFKIPLQGISNITETFINTHEQNLTKRQRGSLSLILGIATNLSSLVDDILDFSKLKQGMLSVHPVQLDVRLSVMSVLNIVTFTSNKSDVMIYNQIPRNLPFVYADDNRFRQIIHNLIAFALKNTENGIIVLSAIENKDFIEISVLDTGKGIEPHLLEHIFENNENLEASKLEGFKELGMGLSIIRELIHLHSGQIWARSTVDEGSVFTFSLPVFENELITEDTQGISEEENDSSNPMNVIYPYHVEKGNDLTVLLVDDDQATLQILMDVLVSNGLNVICVRDGTQALQQIHSQQKIDLVVLNIMMPEISGLVVCEIIRRDFNLSELPILMLSAAIQPENKIVAFQLGANDFMYKPFELSEFKMRVHNLLTMKQAAATAINMEVAFLQAQINPHLIDNLLNSIMYLSYSDPEKVRMLIANLSIFIRGSLSFTNTQQKSSIKNELILIESYLEIEKERFKDRLQVELLIEEGIAISLPPLLIQPLVENAIRHGIGKKMDGGWVRISIKQAGDYYRFQVSDNGVGMSQEMMDALYNDEWNASMGVGLFNIQRRLRRTYGIGLEINTQEGNGTSIGFTIPVSRLE